MDALIVTMIKIIAAMAVGFLLRKINIINDSSGRGFSSLIIHVTAPCMVFSGIVSMDSSQLQNAKTLLWLGFVIYAVLIALALVLGKALKFGKNAGVIEAAVIFGNVSFLGFPLIQSLYGATGLFYIALLNIHFNLFFYSLGFYLISKSGSGSKRFDPKRLLNTGIISIIIAVIIYFCQIKIPDMILEPINFVGQITSPLSMIVIGSSMASYSLKKVFSRKKIYILSFFKLLIFPLLAWVIFKLTLGDNVLTRVICFYVGMPTAAVVGMTAIAFDGDAENATYCNAMMTILSLASIPALYLIMG